MTSLDLRFALRRLRRQVRASLAAVRIPGVQMSMLEGLEVKEDDREQR